MKNFSPADEEKLIRNYTLIANKTVSRFMNKHRSESIEQEDLVSECMLVLLEHASNSNTLEEAMHFQPMDMVNAMCRYLLTTKPFSYPKRTTDFAKHMNSAQRVIDADIEDIRIIGHDSTNDMIRQIDMESFLSSLQPEEEMVMRLWLQGNKKTEIARTTGTAYWRIVRCFQRVCRKYQN